MNPAERFEVQHVAEVADVIVGARHVVAEYRKGGYVGKLIEAVEESLCKLDTARNVARASTAQGGTPAQNCLESGKGSS